MDSQPAERCIITKIHMLLIQYIGQKPVNISL